VEFQENGITNGSISSFLGTVRILDNNMQYSIVDPIVAFLGGFIVGFITIMIINEAFEQIFIQHYEWFERGWIRLW